MTATLAGLKSASSGRVSDRRTSCDLSCTAGAGVVTFSVTRFSQVLARSEPCSILLYECVYMQSTLCEGLLVFQAETSTAVHIDLGPLITLMRVIRHCDPAGLRLVILSDRQTSASLKANFYAPLRRKWPLMKWVPAQAKSKTPRPTSGDCRLS